MELTSGPVIIFVVLVAAASFAVFRWGRRNEPAAPLDVRIPVPGNTMAVRDGRQSSALVSWLLERALEQTGASVAEDALAVQRIAEAALQAMEDLQTHDSATISLPFLVAGAHGPSHFDVRFRRKADSTFEVVS